MSESEDFSEMLDDDSNPVHKELAHALLGKSKTRELDFKALEDHFSQFDKAFIQKLALQHIEHNKSAVVVDALLKKLEIIERWWLPRPKRIALEPGPTRKMALNALNTRAMDISTWLLTLDLPKLPSIDWTKVEETRERINELSRYKQSDTKLEYEIMSSLRRIIRSLHNARPYRFKPRVNMAPHAVKRRRTKAHETSPEARNAIEILRKDPGKHSVREIASLVGVSHSTLLRSAAFKAEWDQHKTKRRSTLHEQAHDAAGHGVTMQDLVRTTERTKE